MKMPTENRSSARPRHSLVRMAVSLCFVALCFTLVAIAIRSRSNPQLPPAVKKLREIEDAIAAYCEENGHLPHDQRGQAFALYRLHPFVSAEVFRLSASDITIPHWDHNTRQLRGGDVLYINQPIPCATASQLFLMAKPQPQVNWTYAAYTGHGSHSAEFADTPNERVLGSFRTVDDLHVVGSDLFHKLALTHVVSGSSWSTTWDEHGLQSATVAGRSIEYRFSGGRLHTCIITTKDGTLTESFTTDNLGQILDVTRTPDNWQMILGIESK